MRLYARRVVVLALSLAAALEATSVTRVAAQTTSEWPQFGGTSQHTFYNPDPALTTTTAPSLGVKWMANLFSTDLGSPVVAFNSVLQKTVVYVGNERGDLYAIDASNGHMIWSVNLGYQVKLRATPAVAPDGSVWIGTNFSPTMYKVDGATGSVLCSVKSFDNLAIMGSATSAAPGGSQIIYWDSIDGTPVTVNGPIVATNEADCSTAWSFTSYRQGHGGPWVTPAYARSASNENLVFVGTADTDSTEYAVDASTGKMVWDFAAYNPTDYDIGEAATVSLPANNGFADGVVYVAAKYGIYYALDMSTGAVLWQRDLYPSGWTGLRNTISSGALSGDTVVMGYANGVQALDAVTGANRWTYNGPAEVASSPAIAGPSGSQVVAFSDYTGAWRVFNLATGAQLYKYQTSNYITASTAVANGTFFVSSADGFLYAFAPGGGNGTRPVSSVSSPSNNGTVANPNGSLTISGSSSDGTSVAAVEIAVQENGSAGNWYNAATNAWQNAPVRNYAVLASPGAPTTSWSFALPVPTNGGSYEVFANTVNGANLVDKGAASNFTVSPSKNEPTVKVSSTYVQPGGTFTASGNAFKPGETVTYTLLGASVATATAGTAGNVPQTVVQVPSNATFGPTSLTLTGGTSGKTSSATVTITNDWTQFGYSSLRAATEPNDQVIANTIDVGKNTILATSWVYPTGAAVNDSPAIVNGVAYIGNDAGTMTAVMTQSGSAKWKTTIPSHAPIHGSPALDPSGNVIFGANDGNLYILSSAGAITKTVALGGDLGNPAVTNNTVIIASDNGTLSALTEPGGTIKWQAHAAGPIHSSPSYDARSGVVIAGDDTGAITAYDAGTGAQRWKVQTGGAVTAPPAVYNGNVYVGSADKNLYALKESTGTQEFKFAADGAISAGATIGGASNITFGTSAGSIYQIQPNGKQLFHEVGKYGNTPIVGLADVYANAIATSQGGMIGITREEGTLALNPWTYQTNAGVSSAAAVINGTVYLGAGDGNLYAFSPNGAVPMAISRNGGAIIKITSGWTCATGP